MSSASSSRVPAEAFCPLPAAGGCSREARSPHRLPFPSFQGLFPPLGPVLSLVLTYPIVLVTSSRLHDTAVAVGWLKDSNHLP